jgi:MOSC domain-containing protein YiiM
LSWGAFGENLTTEGLWEDKLCIGGLVRVESAVLRVTQPPACRVANLNSGSTVTT